MTLTNFSLSGKIPVLIVGTICFKNIVEMLSNPQDALFGKWSIVFETVCSSISCNANLQFNLSVK